MNKWLAVVGTLAALAYFGYVRETEARFLRRRVVCCPRPVCYCVPCPPPVYCTIAPPPPMAATPAPVAAVPAVEMPKPVDAVPTPPIPSIPAVATTGKLYVVLIVDDKAKDGDANRAGAALLERLVRESLPKDRIASVVALSGSEITQEKIRDRLAALPIRGDDAVLCYYAGPSSYDDATHAYTLTPDGVKLPRSELRAELQLHKPGLIVLLTDSPAYGAQTDAMKPLAFPTAVAPLEQLLLGTKGLIDLNAATGGETAFARGHDGGLFTIALVQALAKGPASWAKAVADTATGTNDLLKQYDKDVRGSDAAPDDVKAILRRQKTQTVVPLSPLEPSSALPPPTSETVRVADVPPRPAEIVVKLPAGAKLFIDGEPTRQTAAERRFETPEMKPGQTFVYALRAEFAKDGQAAVRTATVEVRAGDEKVVVIAD